MTSTGSADLRAPGCFPPGKRSSPVVLARAAAGGAKLAGALAGGLLTLVALLLVVLTVVPHVLPYRAYAIESGSMVPTLPVGSEVVLRPVRGDQLQVGDIITFKRPDNRTELVTHRIVRIEHRRGRRVFVTKGDANAVPDAWRVPSAGAGWRYAFEIPYSGYLVQALRLPVARLGLLMLIALLLGTAAVRRIWTPPSHEKP